MRTTLLSLIIMAGMSSVQAATLSDAVLTTSQASNTLSGSYSGSFSFTLVLSTDGISKLSQFIGSNISDQKPVLGSLSATYIIGTGLGYTSSNNIISDGGFYMEYGATTSGQISNYKGGSNIFSTYTGSWDSIEGIAITVGHTNTTQTDLTVTVMKKNSTSETGFSYDEYTATSDSLKWSSGFGTWTTFDINTDYVSTGYLFTSILSGDEAKSINQAALLQSIPELSTASLSLFGLLSLLLRRRRA